MTHEHRKDDQDIQEDNLFEIDLHSIYTKLMKHRRVFMSFVYVFVGTALLYSFIARPVYRSTARIMVEGKAPKITKVENTVFTDYADRDNYHNSQIEVLKSHAVANLVYDELGGYDPWGSLRGRARVSNLNKDERVNRLLKTICITPIRMTQIIEISAEDVDRELAGKIANSWVNAYVIFSSLDQFIQRRSELEADIDQNLKYVKEMHPIIQGLRSEIAAINANIDGEKQKAFNTNIKILDLGQVAKTPVRPRLLFNLIIALMMGAFAGIGYVLILESMDQSIKIQADIDTLVHMPCLAVLPQYVQKKSSFPCALASAHDVNSMFAERFRSLRTSIIYSNPDIDKKIILISSVGPAEGKSTVAVNLATAFAQSEGKVLLIDADLRRPTLHTVFTVPCENGLTELLVSQGADCKVYVKNTAVTNLHFISCGMIPLNPAELLGSKKFELLISELSKSYDRIIIDAPPILAATDAVILSTKVDTTILVFKAGFTHKQAAMKAVKVLRSVHAKVLGVVLNMVKVGEYEDYSYYNYYSQKADNAQS